MSSHDTKVLNSLIATTIDSANGYEDAARRTSDARLTPIFDKLGRDRRETVSRLEGQVRQLGGEPEDSGTLKAAAHRRWLELKDALGTGDRAVLDSVEAGETYIREKYEAALKDRKLSAGARNAVADAFTSVASGKAQVSELRQRCGFPEPRSGGSWTKVGLGLGAAAAVAGVAVAASKRGGQRSRDADDDAFALQLDTDENLRLISSKKVEGTPVLGRDGERLGTVDSFMVDKYTGRVGYAVMTFGGTLGFGASLFPLPWSALTYREAQGGYVINMTRDELADAPRFEPSSEPEFDVDYRRQILVFYRPGGGARRAAGTRAAAAGRPAAVDGSRAASASDGGRGQGEGRDSAFGRSDSGRGGYRDAGAGVDRMAAGGPGQDEGRSGGFGSPGGGSFGAAGDGSTKA